MVLRQRRPSGGRLGLSDRHSRGFVYAYDAYIDPPYRNTGIWLRFKAYLGEWMAARGKRGVLTFIDYGNWPSLRTHLRFGFEPTESVVAVRVIGLGCSAKCARLARRHGPSSHGSRCIRRRCTCITPRERSTSPWRSSAGNQALGGAGARSSRMRSWARRCQSSNRDGP